VCGAQLKAKASRKAIAARNDNRFEDVTDRPDEKPITESGEKAEAPQTEPRRSDRLRKKAGR